MTEQLAETWGVSSQAPRVIKLYSFGEETNVIIGSASGCEGSGFFPSNEEAIVNARKMAAAPELLEALQAAMQFLDEPAGLTPDVAKDPVQFEAFMKNVKVQEKAAIEKARAAIAKALGA